MKSGQNIYGKRRHYEVVFVCISSPSAGSEAGIVLEAGRRAKDPKLRELALTVLARLGRTDPKLVAELRDWLTSPELRWGQNQSFPLEKVFLGPLET